MKLTEATHYHGLLSDCSNLLFIQLLTADCCGVQGQADRVNYLMTKQAKIVAMTCTHAALKRREFLQLGLKYDNLLMEESAQILEIETFIPMLLQVGPSPSMHLLTLAGHCLVASTLVKTVILCSRNRLRCCVDAVSILS